MNTEQRILTLKKTVGARQIEHGKRASYIAGCRCMLCRAANSRYSCERAAAQRKGDYRGLVPADKVREYLHALSKKGVGYKSVADAAGVSKTILARVLWGKRLHVRANTERAVLAITAEAIAGGALVPASRVWKKLDRLIDMGYSKSQLARWMGYKRPALQINRRQVTAATAAKVDRLCALIEQGKLRRDR